MGKNLPPLVADGGELRLARRVASYVYGRREVTWPEGVNDPEDELPDGREFGWVAKLPGPEPGLSERRFVRADVRIDAVEQVSDVERVLNDAASRAGGDVFFGSLIEGRGLGRLVPGRDFDEGDLVDVRFWGRILPGQLVTAVEWHGGVPSVKLGGQAVSDVDNLSRARGETLRLISRERRERQESVSQVSSVASVARSEAGVARSVADSAVADAAYLRGVLGGTGASETTLFSQLAAINAQIVAQGGEQQPGLLPMYISMNTRLWEQQQKTNEQQDVINEQQKKINAARDEAEQAMKQAQAATSRDMTRMLFADRGQRVWDERLSVSMPGLNRTLRVTQSGSWRGRVVLQVAYSNGDYHQRANYLYGNQTWTYTVPIGDVANALVFYQVESGGTYGSGANDN